METIARMAREGLLCWVLGSAIFLLLVLLRATDALPHLTDVLLMPGIYIAHVVGRTTRDIGIALIVLSDEIFYGFLFFVLVEVVRKCWSAF
jgi:hypothetical protein